MLTTIVRKFSNLMCAWFLSSSSISYYQIRGATFKFFVSYFSFWIESAENKLPPLGFLGYMCIKLYS